MTFGPIVSQFPFPYLIPNGQDLLLPASLKALWFSKLPPRSLINLAYVHLALTSILAGFFKAFIQMSPPD